MENYFIVEDETYVGVKFKEYKELLIIKGKYEELKNVPKLEFNSGIEKQNDFTILPCNDLKRTNDLDYPHIPQIF